MNRRRFCCTFGAAGLTAWHVGRSINQAATTAFAEQNGAQRSANALGTSVRIAVCHPSRQEAEDAVSAALAEVEVVESVMSIYRPETEISRLNRFGVLRSPHPYLVDLLRRSLRISRDTDGAFDITVQSLWQLYQEATDDGRLPNAQQVRRARERIGWRSVQVRDDRIKLNRAVQLTLNGIAQGFATDRAKHVLLDRGMKAALIDIGELAAMGVNHDGQPWRVGIQHPRNGDAFVSVARVEDRCLATSGDYNTTFTADHKIHHVFDPKTGTSPTELASVSVLAPTATEADALSTALLVLGIQEGVRLLGTRRGVDAMFVRKDGRASATAGFPNG